MVTVLTKKILYSQISSWIRALKTRAPKYQKQKSRKMEIITDRDQNESAKNTSLTKRMGQFSNIFIWESGDICKQSPVKSPDIKTLK